MQPSHSTELSSSQIKIFDEKALSLRKLIAVTEPYYALQNVCIHNNNVLSANIPVELLNHMEPYGMSMAEMGRHMAILGSLALANINPKKEQHYYLATHAVVERKHNRPGNDGMYLGKVKARSLTKRKGEIYGELYDTSGDLISTIEIEYAVIHHTVFKRMFSGKKTSTNINSKINPYCRPSQLYQVKLTHDWSCAMLGEIKAEDCLGHFENYPAMPVARLGGALRNLAGLHYNYYKNSNEKYCVQKAEINTKTFVSAGRSLKLHSILKKDKDTNMCYVETVAQLNEREIAADCKLWFF